MSSELGLRMDSGSVSSGKEREKKSSTDEPWKRVFFKGEAITHRASRLMAVHGHSPRQNVELPSAVHPERLFVPAWRPSPGNIHSVTLPWQALPVGKNDQKWMQ